MVLLRELLLKLVETLARNLHPIVLVLRISTREVLVLILIRDIPEAAMQPTKGLVWKAPARIKCEGQGRCVVGCRREFVVRDPASSSATLLVSEIGLEEARKSFGTDEDILLVSRANPDPAMVSSRLPLM